MQSKYGPSYNFTYDLNNQCAFGLCALLSSDTKSVTKKDYFKWMKKNHPDKGGNTAFAQAVNNCWEFFKESKEEGNPIDCENSGFD